MDIAIDFDGTLVTHEYPNVGKDNEGSVNVVKELIKKNHNIILYTMRSGKTLQDAIEWCKKHEIPLYGVNYNPSQTWTESPKAYAQLYIDDAALGCPIKFDKNISSRVFVDWIKVREMLVNMNIIN